MLVSVLVFFCCLTNNHKPGSLKQPIYYLTVLYVSNEGRLSWILCWRPHKADIKVKWMLFGSSGNEFSSKYFQVVGQFQFFVVKGLNPCSLVFWGSCSASRTCHILHHLAACVFKLVMLHYILLTQNLWLPPLQPTRQKYLLQRGSYD